MIHKEREGVTERERERGGGGGGREGERERGDVQGSLRELRQQELKTILGQNQGGHQNDGHWFSQTKSL